MAFTETERVQIRRWLGFPALYIQADPRLESAITTIQSTAEGGGRPDNSTELAVRGYLATLATYEARWTDMREAFEASKTDDLVTDHARAQMMLERSMRLYVGYIADTMDISPRRDVFTPKSPLY
jgi:hypothetical protein